MKFLNLLALVMIVGCAGAKTKPKKEHFKKEVFEIQARQFEIMNSKSRQEA